MSTVLSVISLSILSTKNPVKLSMVVMILSLTMFTMAWTETSISWIPMIMVLLFTGGILIMFMILTSFQPNESPSKNKNLLILMLSLALATSAEKFFYTNQSQESGSEIPLELKAFYQSWSTSGFLTTIMLLYFCSFIKIMSKEENSMRSILCHSMKLIL